MSTLDHLTPEQRARYDAIMADLARLPQRHEQPIFTEDFIIHPDGWVSRRFTDEEFAKLQALLEAAMDKEQHE